MVEVGHHSASKNSWAQQTTKNNTKTYFYKELKNLLFMIKSNPHTHPFYNTLACVLRPENCMAAFHCCLLIYKLKLAWLNKFH